MLPSPLRIEQDAAQKSVSVAELEEAMAKLNIHSDKVDPTSI